MINKPPTEAQIEAARRAMCIETCAYPYGDAPCYQIHGENVAQGQCEPFEWCPQCKNVDVAIKAALQAAVEVSPYAEATGDKEE